jgi:hypothetical protein
LGNVEFSEACEKHVEIGGKQWAWWSRGKKSEGRVSGRE